MHFPKIPWQKLYHHGVLSRDNGGAQGPRSWQRLEYNFVDEFVSPIEKYSQKAYDKYSGFKFDMFSE